VVGADRGVIAMDLALRYRRDGFVVGHGLVDAATVGALRDEAAAIAAGRRGAIDGLAPATADGPAALQHVLAIHFPHKVSALMRGMLAHPPIVEVLTQLIGPDVKAMQSMLFVKHAGQPGQAWHQDETFIPTADASLVGAWIALDDATIDNGCLWVQPGSHAPRRLWPSRACDDARFDGSPESHAWDNARWPPEGGQPVEVAAGSVVFFDGFLLHRSLPNTRASGYRRALVVHCMSARAELPWRFGASRHAPHDYRDIVMVAGHDAFADRGIENLARPYLRTPIGALA
jgi:phytanoyl-CoA hydroxylase